MNAAMWVAVIVACGFVGGSIPSLVCGWRTRRCTACRIESMGGTHVFIPHSCVPWRALRRHSDGSVSEFGRLVR
jgi:hypothetical protein